MFWNFVFDRYAENVYCSKNSARSPLARCSPRRLCMLGFDGFLESRISTRLGLQETPVIKKERACAQSVLSRVDVQIHPGTPDKASYESPSQKAHHENSDELRNYNPSLKRLSIPNRIDYQ